MSNWERKNVDTLADAIAKQIRNHPEMVEVNVLLVIAQQAADEAANTVTTTSGELNRLRAVVCAICRGSKLYECDVPKGWSENCAFVYANNTAFAGL
jgi:hypothetical protein